VRQDPCCGSTGLPGFDTIVLASLAAFVARLGGLEPALGTHSGSCCRFGVVRTRPRQESACAPGTTGLMREESQLDEMRAAIRGDFERLADRRGEQELMRIPADTPEPHSDDGAAEPEGQPRLSWGVRLGRWLTQPEADQPPPGAL
jgi:hypothetical protein